jgi:YVTN family beta-propeller protein
MQIFSPDGQYGYVCSSFNPEVAVIRVADRQVVGKVAQASPFCPNIAATPDGRQVWFTLKDTGKTQVFSAKPPFALLKTLDTGPITNHVNFVRNVNGQFAYVTVGGLDEIKVFRTDDFRPVATIPVGKLPHGIWPSGDGRRVYVGLENDDAMLAIDTISNTVVGTVPIGQAPQAVVYVPGAVPRGEGLAGLVALGEAGEAAHLTLAPPASRPPTANAPTSVSLYSQGLTQVLEASVTGLAPTRDYILALSSQKDGGGQLEPLAAFTTNPAGAAIVNAVGPIRQVIQGEGPTPRRYLCIVSGTADRLGAPVQVQVE